MSKMKHHGFGLTMASIAPAPSAWETANHQRTTTLFNNSKSNAGPSIASAGGSMIPVHQQAPTPTPTTTTPSITAPIGVGRETTVTSATTTTVPPKQKKRRNHRPRGCRGGGSRRARKEKREQQQMMLLRQLQENIQQTTVQPESAAAAPVVAAAPLATAKSAATAPPSRDNSTALTTLSTTNTHSQTMLDVHKVRPTSKLFESENIFRTSNCEAPSSSSILSSTHKNKADASSSMPTLEACNSFSSSGSSEGNQQHPTAPTPAPPSRENNFCDQAFDILPSMPATFSTVHDNQNEYRKMNPLPPMPPSSESFSRPTAHLYTKDEEARMDTTTATSALGKHHRRLHHSLDPTTNTLASTPSQQQHNLPLNTENCDDGILLDSLIPLMHKAKKASELPTNGRLYNNIIINNNNISTAHEYRTERIEKQRQMPTGGGSLFLMSPRSFLLGKRSEDSSFFST